MKMTDNTSLKSDKGCVRGLGCLVALLLGFGVGAPHCDRDAYIVTVTDKERVYESRSSRYLVFTRLQNGQVRVFENTDSLLEGKFDSSDIQGEIEVGKTYQFETYGWRVPLFSEYENITRVTQINPEEQ